MIGSLLHEARATHPDTVYAVWLVLKFNAALTQTHFAKVKRIFQYLERTIDSKLHYRSTGEKLLVRVL